MTTVQDILREKDRAVYTIGAMASILDAAREMNLRRIGALVVTSDVVTKAGSAATRPPGDALVTDAGGHSVVGILTERDILTRVVAVDREPSMVRVGETMTSPLITCGACTTLDELRHVMRHRRIRHVPVVEEGQLVGMVSIGDLNIAEQQVLEQTIRYLETYVYRG